MLALQSFPREGCVVTLLLGYVGLNQNLNDLQEVIPEPPFCGMDPLVAVPHTSMCMGADSFTERTGGPAREVGDIPRSSRSGGTGSGRLVIS